jgi:hypothetical protein
MDTLIKDANGKWYLTKARFAFTDPTTGVMYEPGVYVKATPNDWLAGQAGVIDEVPDPIKAAEDAAKAEAAAVAKAEAEAAKAAKAGA